MLCIAHLYIQNYKYFKDEPRSQFIQKNAWKKFMKIYGEIHNLRHYANKMASEVNGSCRSVQVLNEDLSIFAYRESFKV